MSGAPESITVIVPATDDPPTLAACLSAIRSADCGPEQVVVVEDAAITHPGLARNAGARRATGDILVFIDADVTVHADVFVRIRELFAAQPDLTAMFGSYDDAPKSQGVVSRFRNLLHHHVHQSSGGPASTFWSGLGAVRRDAFEVAGGFVAHPIEDIEFGMRIARQGARIVLDPGVQGTHLKHWSAYGMVRTDLLVRGIPWVRLLLAQRHAGSSATLNFSWRYRISALACVVIFLALITLHWWLMLSACGVLVALNWAFYALLFRTEGPVRAVLGVGLHTVHLLVAIAAVPLGLVQHLIAGQNARHPVQQKQ